MKYLLIIGGLLLSFAAFSQTIKGSVVDHSGKPVPAASIYIKESKQGSIANGDGEFQFKLSPGIYHLEVRCMGYESRGMEIKVMDEDLELTVELAEKDFQLKEVEVFQKEDPAYEIMRQAIKKAPYYQSVVKESTYKTYIKGGGKITHIPKLINSMTDGDLEKYKDEFFMQESVSEIKFTAPDKYEQDIIAYSNTFPNGNDPKAALSMGLVSLYRPMYGSAVSPLHPQAFDYYRFRYEGYEEDNDRIVNKIRIIPKLKDPKLMEGIIYIADEEWNIRHAEIKVSSMGTTQLITQNYYPVVNNIYLINTYKMNLEMNFLGMKLSAEFLSSIQYTDILLNDSLLTVSQENNLFKKKKERKSLEIKEDSRIKKTVDSLAVKRDSLYWSEVRTVVLNEEELKSYERKSRMQALTDSLHAASTKFEKNSLIMGGKLGNDSSWVQFHYSGLLGTFPDYNYVDGLWLGQSVGFDFRKKKNTGFQLNPSVYWTSARKAIVWNAEILLDYAPKRLGKWSFSIGKQSEDFSGTSGMNRFLSMVYALDGVRNYTKFYEKRYGRMSNEIDLLNGLQFGLSLESTHRQELVNHTTWNFFGRKNHVVPNIPEYNQAMNLEYSDLAQYSIRLTYTPEYYYRMKKGKKQYVRSRFPTFELDYQQGLELQNRFLGDHQSVFRRMELSIKQKVKWGLFNRLDYTLIAGKYFNNNPFNYIDYKHFNKSGPWLSFKDWKNAYALLPYYTCSTAKEWIQVFVNYDTDYLLAKRLPFLQGKLFTETLQAKFLHTPDKKYYSEWGYSINLPFGLGGAGVFVAFDSFRYNSFGLQFAIPLFSILKRGNNEITLGVEY
jgi:hypothetical protein